ncbi:MAG: TldD/PmbA family protein [candidate division WOR-3 bacterium]
MEERIIEKLKGRVEGFEIIVDEILNSLSEFRGDEPYSLETKETKGLGLRVIKDGKLGFAATTDPNRIPELVESTIQIANYGEKVNFTFPKEIPQVKCQLVNEGVKNTSAAQLFSLGKEIIAETKRQFPQFKIDLNLNHTIFRRRLVNSSGFIGEYEKVSYTLSFIGLIVGDDGLIWIYDYKNLSNGQPFSVLEFVNRQVLLAQNSLKKVPLETKEYPVIFAPSYGLIEFLFPLLVGVNGKNFQKRITPLLGQEGKEIGSPLLSVYDDGLLDYASGSAPFDGEGIAKGQTPLIEKGVFKNFLFDLKTASLCGRKSTGNASRSYSSEPLPGANNLVISPGRGTLLAGIQGIKEGVLIYEVIGGGQSNVLAGDFSLSVGLGFKIEDGEIKGRVKDCMIAGNFYEVIKRVSQIGGELKDLGNFYLPFIKFEDVKVTGK